MDTSSTPRKEALGTVLDDAIVRAANETANNQIEQFAQTFSHDFAAAAAAGFEEVDVEEYDYHAAE